MDEARRRDLLGAHAAADAVGALQQRPLSALAGGQGGGNLIETLLGVLMSQKVGEMVGVSPTAPPHPMAEKLRSFAFHGKGATQYDNIRVGINSRLDTLQAAILIEKLAILEDEMVARQAVAERYAQGLGDVVRASRNLGGGRSAWAQYAIETPKRDGLKAHLQEKGIPSVIYYVKPLHSQMAYKDYPRTPTGLTVSETLPERILCLPMHPYLAKDDQDRIIETIRNYIGSNSEQAAAE